VLISYERRVHVEQCVGDASSVVVGKVFFSPLLLL
jgi:hypothetical protein